MLNVLNLVLESDEKVPENIVLIWDDGSDRLVSWVTFAESDCSCCQKVQQRNKNVFLQRKLKFTQFLCSRFDLIERFLSDFVLHLFRNNVTKLLLGHLYEHNLLEIKLATSWQQASIKEERELSENTST